MILYRSIFQARFGKGKEVAATFKALLQMLPDESLRPRILTDISGPFDTVVLETTHKSLAAVEQFRIAMHAQEAAAGPQPVMDLIESGRNEYYTIEV